MQSIGWKKRCMRTGQILLLSCVSCLLVSATAAASDFVEVGALAGVNSGSDGQGVAWGDYDGDGWVDLLVSNWASNSARAASTPVPLKALPVAVPLPLSTKAGS